MAVFVLQVTNLLKIGPSCPRSGDRAGSLPWIILIITLIRFFPSNALFNSQIS